MWDNCDPGHLIGDIIRSSLEWVSLEDCSEELLPRLERLLNASGTLLYRVDPASGMVPLGGRISDLVAYYEEHYRDEDPVFSGLMMRSPQLQRISQLPEWDAYTKSKTYLEFTRPNGMDDFYHLVLGGNRFQGEGSWGLIISRSHTQEPFRDRDTLYLAQIFQSLEALARRTSRLENQMRSIAIYHSMLEQGFPHALALDFNGNLIWGSAEILKRLSYSPNKKPPLPEALILAARKLGSAFVNKSPATKLPNELRLKFSEQPPLQFELKVSRTRSGEPFILAQWVNKNINTLLQGLADQFQLTPSETQILDCLGKGLSDREIATTLCVSLPTVRTHVGHILSKLDVPSRVQAALLAHDILPRPQGPSGR